MKALHRPTTLQLQEYQVRSHWRGRDRGGGAIAEGAALYSWRVVYDEKTSVMSLL